MNKIGKYTFSANLTAEETLKIALPEIAENFAASKFNSMIDAVILCGGYGRGEGGATPDGGLYNDLDFFVIVNSPLSEEFQIFLNDVSARWHVILKIDVDFCPVTINQLKRNALTLMIQELLAGHEVIFGQQDILDEIPHINFSSIPVSEGARLLLNRGCGILLAKQKLQHGLFDSDTEFVRRNLHKAALGCGDALLIATHKYLQSGTERLMAINTIANQELKDAYKAALEYKYTPVAANNENITNWFNTTLFLWNESLCNFTGENSTRTAAWKIAECDHDYSLRFAALNLCYFSKIHRLFPFFSHPRLKLLSMLEYSLNNESNPAKEAKFLNLWRRFN